MNAAAVQMLLIAAAAFVAAADAACAPPPRVEGGRWSVAGGGRQATLLCDQGGCAIDDCVSAIGVLACAAGRWEPVGWPPVGVTGQWTGLSDAPGCPLHSAPGGVVERPTSGDGHCIGKLISQMCTVERVAELADTINCLNPCVKAMAACAGDTVMEQMLGATARRQGGVPVRSLKSGQVGTTSQMSLSLSTCSRSK